MKVRQNFGTVVDFLTFAVTVNWNTDLTKIKAAGHPGKGRKTKPRPFSLVARYGRGRGTIYRVVGSFARLGNAARAKDSLPAGVPAWICLAPGYTLAAVRGA